MSRIRFLTGGGLACCLLLAGAVCASAQVRVEVDRRGERGREGHHLRASKLIGAAVTLENNASGGKVEDVVIGRDGTVDYLVVAHGDRFVAVPWGAANIDFDRHTVAVEIPEARFREVPAFTRDKWPDFNDSKWVEGVNRHFKIRPRERREERREDRR
ncbi:MAG TPA: PRC-barrel domain-containing protein [Gemmataceae bacterium]|nr:PRC-barrel domain-containing protein [Gemmataceae bacterium]